MKIPNGEELLLTYTDGGNIFYLTANAGRTLYYGYKDCEGKLVKLGRGKTPPEVEELFKANEKIKSRTKKVD